MDMIKKENIDQLTHKIIGCAMKVHSTLGNGFQEVIYQRGLSHRDGKARVRLSTGNGNDHFLR